MAAVFYGMPGVTVQRQAGTSNARLFALYLQSTGTDQCMATLYLDGVVTQNGVLMAQLRYNGTSYTLGAGGVIPNPPWQGLRDTTASVTMLYGAIQVTLSVGEGVTK